MIVQHTGFDELITLNWNCRLESNFAVLAKTKRVYGERQFNVLAMANG